MKCEAIADYLESLAIADMGEIFVHEMPESCKHGVLLMDTYSGTAINHYMPKWRDTGLRLIVRTAQYARGEALATEISNRITTHAETPMGVLLVRKLLPVTEPKPYRRSDGGYVEFEVELEITYIAP